MGSEDLDEAVAVFAAVRPRLFGIAYRMLSSVTEAEDLVQEVWLRWQKADRSAVLDPAAYLATTTTRLAINELQSARVRRETYVGPWLPEPVDTTADPALGAERGEALEFAALVLMERLTPLERAAYVLREAFDYSYASIASILGSASEAAVRQLVSRARKHVTGSRRTPVSPEARRELLTTFVAAARSGDLAALERLFVADVTSLSDSDGKARAARHPIVGAAALAKVVAAYAGSFWKGAELRYSTFNGQPAVVLWRDGAASAVVSVDATAEGISRVWWMVNPAKLTAVS